MDQVNAQYEVYPYPERDPKDEKKRLITGSPSIPMEIDTYLFEGKRDWSEPLRVLFAGGGTGDGLIQFAQFMAQANRPCEITYVDLSTASRAIAEERAKMRNLDGIRFETGTLLDAANYGEFDYIDCCGVLHHLEKPVEGFKALEAALATDGGIGAMVYAPYGRAGVYALQESFNALFGHLPPEEKLAEAKRVYNNLSEHHPFKANPHLVDHEQSDAGFYDLLLHSQDRAFDVTSLIDVIGQAGLRLVSFVPPATYDLDRFGKDLGADLDAGARMALAEKLDGGIKRHVFYMAKAEDKNRKTLQNFQGTDVPHLLGVDPRALADRIGKSGELVMTMNGKKHRIALNKNAVQALAQINGQRSIQEIASVLKIDPILYNGTWSQIDQALHPLGVLVYSGLYR